VLFLLMPLVVLTVGLAVFLSCALLACKKANSERKRLTTLVSNLSWRKARWEQERRELSGRLIRAQEEERRRIGRELHDDLNQQLALLAIGLAQLSVKLPPQTRKEVELLLDETKRLSEWVHRLSHGLHPSVLDHLGLVAAARNLCDEFTRQRNFRVRFTDENFPAELSPEISLCLFRVLQECLNNISKHSHGSLAQVTLAGTSEGIHMETRDNGIGFDPDDQRNRCGLGLLSISERLCLVGGSLEIHSTPSRGTTVNVWIPAQATARKLLDPFAARRPNVFATPGFDGESDGARTGTSG
jgi:signal transduction histidine kinase